MNKYVFHIIYVCTFVTYIAAIITLYHLSIWGLKIFAIVQSITYQRKYFPKPIYNKANLRDLIAATGLVISYWIKIVDFSACVTLKFDGWPHKSIAHVFYTISNFVNHFKSIGEFKLELQSINAQFGSILVIFFPAWPWNLMILWKTIGHLFYTTSSFVRHFKSIGEVKLELQSRNTQFGSKLVIFCSAWPWNLIDDLEKQ